MTVKPDKSAIYEKLDYWENSCGINREALENGIAGISCKTEDDIYAAANIMEACTSYIIYKELIIPENSKLINAARAYIEEHSSEDIRIETLCSELKIGRTKLYEIFREELNIGVSKYILKRRMHRAKNSLKPPSFRSPRFPKASAFPITIILARYSKEFTADLLIATENNN